MTSSSSFFVSLPPRGLIHIEGEDRFDFLQRLISNDIDLLKTQSSIYACLLTPQGKFLHDFFISQGPDSLIIECEGKDRAQDLFDRLTKYKLRSNVCISVEDMTPIYVCFGEQPYPGYPDTRHAGLGWRSFIKPSTIKEEPTDLWDSLRINLEIADGSRDAQLERSTPEELNITQCNGVSYTKGCYIGQELTARIENRGLAKKHLKLIRSQNTPFPAFGELIKNGDRVIGEMRSSCHDIGLAVLKD